MKSKLGRHLFVLCTFLALSVAHAQESHARAPAKTASNQTQLDVLEPLSNLEYPPIRLEVSEADLSPGHIDAKKELIETSQYMEDVFHSQGAIYREPELEKVLNELLPVEQLGDRAKGFYYRIYVLKDPLASAMTTPTGSIYINTGLLAALDNLNQLRAVMAHEVHHNLDQDIVYKFKSLKEQVGFLKTLQLVSGPAVAVAIGESDSSTGKTIANVYSVSQQLAFLSLRFSIAGYGRQHETECDAFAMEVFKDNGYSLAGLTRLFEMFEQRRKDYGKSFSTHLLSTHETPKQRRKRVAKFAKENEIEIGEEPDEEKAVYDRLVRKVRLENARLNIRAGRIHRALKDIERVETSAEKLTAIKYLRGEAYKKLAEDPTLYRQELSAKTWRDMKIKDVKKHKEVWAEDSRKAYTSAIEEDATFSDAYRGLGLLQLHLEEYESADGNLRKYLEISPDAKDKRYVEAKLGKVERMIEKASDDGEEEKK